MRTPQQIIDEASKRYNAATQGYGFLSRQDIVDFLAQVSPDMDKRTELNAFLDECSFVRPPDKNKLMLDLPSYGL